MNFKKDYLVTRVILGYGGTYSDNVSLQFNTSCNTSIIIPKEALNHNIDIMEEALGAKISIELDDTPPDASEKLYSRVYLNDTLLSLRDIENVEDIEWNDRFLKELPNGSEIGGAL